MFTERYIQHELLGRGGMGAVYRATDRLTNETVALKRVITPTTPLHEASAAPNALRLVLAREFSILASLRHPNIISVLDYGFDGEKRPFFTMTYLENAQTILEAAARKPLPQQVQLIQQMLQALVYLHRRGILHRDLKPENVLVTQQRVRVLDFGLAAAKEEASESVGTWLYIAPEVLNDQPATEAADLYAVGVLAYRIFLGHHPFDIYAPDYLEQVLFEPPDLTEFGDKAALAAVVGKLLAKQPEERFASAQAAITAFNEAIGLTPPQEQTAVRESFLQAAKFVGRIQEINQLQTALTQARQGHGSAWLIGGESGVGKSRLIDEIRIQALVSGALVLSGHSQENRSDLPFQLWQDVIRRLLLGPPLSNLTIGVLQALIPDITTLLEQPVIPPPQLEGQAGRQRLISTITSLFEQQNQWMLLILEDLHWASESLDVLTQLNRLVEHLPLLIIGTYRNDERPSLPNELPQMQTITLERFSPAEMSQLSTSMLGHAGAKPEILTLLQRETEGNPFFLVEVVRTLAEEAGRLSDIEQMTLPTTLFPKGIETIVRRRLAQLPAHMQPLLPGTAVAGRQVDPAIIHQLARQQALTFDIETWLATCADAAILHVHENKWHFAHDKIREGLLHSLSPQQKQTWHHAVAQAIETIYPDDAAQAAALAHHWQQTGNTSKEQHYTLIAGHYASQRFANTEAITHYNRALALTSPDDLQRQYNILLAREEVWGLLGNRTAQQEDLTALESVGNRLATQSQLDRRSEIALHQAHYAETIGDYPATIRAAQQTIALAQHTQNVTDETAGYLAWGRALVYQADYEGAEQKLQLTLQKARQHQLGSLLADTYRSLGMIAADQENNSLANAHYQAALTIYQENDDQLGATKALNNLGGLAYSTNNFSEAILAWDKVRQLYVAIGDREGLSRALINLSLTQMALGQYAAADTLSQEAYQICREIDVRLGACFAMLNQSWINYAQGRFETAVSYAQQTQQAAQELGITRFSNYATLYLGHCYVGLAKYDDAKQAYNQAYSVWEELKQPSPLLDTLGGLVRIALLQNELPEGISHVEKILHMMAALPDEDSILLDVFPACCHLLQATNDPRWEGLLRQGVNILHKRAQAITDPTLRYSFLHNISAHQEILDLAHRYVISEST
ncbi:MAG: protein kinase [Chloroflexota bacterium]